MDTTVYHSGTSSRQRSSESDASADPVSKRQKSLDTQRAFRARKAAHVKDLEVKVALQDLEVARLKRENEALKQELQALKNATAGSTNCGSAAAQSCNPKPDNGGHTPSVLKAYQANPLRTDAPPHLTYKLQTNSNPPKDANFQNAANYSTSILPVVPSNYSNSMPSRALPPAPLSSMAVPAPSTSMQSSFSSSSSHEAQIPLQTAPTHMSPPPPPLTQVSQVVCCNGMFRCDDEEETRWIKENTGIKGIGSNTMDDFYALFGGDYSAATATLTEPNAQRSQAEERMPASLAG